MNGVKCGMHNLELEEVRPGKFLCPEPECTHITMTAQLAQMQDWMWAQANGMVHPDAMEIPPSRDYRYPAKPEGQSVSEFKSVYGQLMAATPLGGGVSVRQEAALRDLDEIMAVAEHVLRGTPVGAGAHSTICALLMDAYSKGQLMVTKLHGEALPQRDAHGFLDLTCGNCGTRFGTNLDDDEIQCTDCEARRCPCCGSWFGARD